MTPVIVIDSLPSGMLRLSRYNGKVRNDTAHLALTDEDTKETLCAFIEDMRVNGLPNDPVVV